MRSVADRVPRLSALALLGALLAASVAVPMLADAHGRHGHERKGHDAEREVGERLTAPRDETTPPDPTEAPPDLPEPPPPAPDPAPAADAEPEATAEPTAPAPDEPAPETPTATGGTSATGWRDGARPILDAGAPATPDAPPDGAPTALGAAGVLALTFRHVLVVGGMAMLVALALVLTARKG